ncbi:DUF5819 family protein [Microbacterium halotolerans]|uniref:DUF5819 family protein n=1 Tax=Microbacterium halotolerans TaxID=246613 RepID=UPI000E6AC4B7|nr:DUF5819 family protein [Microbacterium halotolerans]
MSAAGSESENGHENQPSRSSRAPRSARIAAGVAAAFLAIHIFFTAVYNTPYPHIRDEVLPGAAATAYIEPYLQQDYRIFAPNPANSDRNLWLRAWVETPDGERVITEWVDATAIELVEPARRVLRKQFTVQASLRLIGTYFDMSEGQREVAAQNFSESDDLTPLQDELLAADADKADEVHAFIRATNFATSYATQAAQALWGDEGEVVAVQTRAVTTPIVRWEHRFDDGAVAPGASYSDTGWLPPMEWSEQSTPGFAASFLTWAEKAGVSTELPDDARPADIDDPDADGIGPGQEDG